MNTRVGNKEHSGLKDFQQGSAKVRSMVNDLARRGFEVSTVSPSHFLVSSDSSSIHVLIPSPATKYCRNDINALYSDLLVAGENVIFLNEVDAESVSRILAPRKSHSVRALPKSDNKTVASRLGVYYTHISQCYETFSKDGTSCIFAVRLDRKAPVIEIASGQTEAPVEALDALVAALRKEDNTRCIFMKDFGNIPLAMSEADWKVVPTRRRIVSERIDGLFRLRSFSVSTGLPASHSDFLSLAPRHKENMMAIMFPSYSIYELRKKASENGIKFLDWPEALSGLSYVDVSHARGEHVVPEQVAAALGVDRRAAKMACDFYGVQLPDGGRSRLASHQMEEYKRQTGFGSPAARPEVQRKIRSTNVERYGVDNPFKDEKVQSRIRDTMYERYGESNPMQVPEIREAATKTMVERYGAKTTLESPVLREKVRKTMMERYGVLNPGQSDSIMTKIAVTNVERYGTSYSGHAPTSNERRHAMNQLRYGVDEVMQCPEIRERACKAIWKSVGSNGLSAYERQVKAMLDGLGLVADKDYLVNDYTNLGTLQLDFILPSRSLAIEVSPTWTHHSNVSTPKEAFIQPKPISYHRKKYELSKDKGLELITLFDWMLEEPMWSDITKDFLNFRITGLASRVFYGREVVISMSSRSERKACIDFCRKFHFQGVVPSKEWFSVRLKDSGEMVGAFSVSPARSDPSSLELKRVCWKPGVQVRYGLSKIVKHLEREYSSTYTGIVSFSDNNIGSGSSYEKAGFTFVKETRPSLVFVNTRHPQDRYSWSVATPWSARSGVIASALGSMIVSNTEARQIVETRLPHRHDNGVGYSSLYDTGNKLWRKDFNND